MKSFLNFISEATASQQAARLGLVGDGMIKTQVSLQRRQRKVD